MAEPFGRARTARATGELIETLVPYFALSTLMLLLTQRGHTWISLALSVPAAAFLVRTFIIFHDCCHGSFFRSQRANDLLGGLIGVLTLTPYAYWRKTHALHHATSGNLEHRGFGDIDTLTVS